MILFALLAALAALITCWVHTFLGHRFVFQPITQSSAHAFSRATFEVCWHFATLALVLFVVALLAAALPWVDKPFGPILLTGVLLLSTFFALMFLWVSKRRFNSYATLPQSRLLGAIALFTAAALAYPLQVSVPLGLGMVLALFLFCLAAIHVLWALGSTWPAKTGSELTELVVGTSGERPFPAKNLTLLVAGLLAAAGIWVLLSGTGFANRTLSEYGTGFLAVLFFVRGFGGYWDYRLRPWTRQQPFAYWNRVLYSPICLLMSLLAAGMLWGGS